MTAPHDPDPLWEATDMDGQSPEEKARKALTHLLHQVRTRPALGYELGLGSAAFAKLTEAYAALTGQPVRKVREAFVCTYAKPAGKEDAERLDFLEERLRQMPDTYVALIGLPRGWAKTGNLRQAVDAAREQGRLF